MQPIAVIVGPTASGKSQLAVDVALELAVSGRRAEIVNADSMLVYRGMDIGTAKPTVEQRASVPHHLIDIMPVSANASVADFQHMARAAIADIRARDGIPIVVGGSALYVRAVLDEFDFPGSDMQIRAKWEAELQLVGAAQLHDRLRELSPESAAKIEPGNARRIVRALEIAELTGGHSASLPQWNYALDNVHQFGLTLDRKSLDERINDRVDQMWQDGLVSEVEKLLEQGLRESMTASRAIGYRQVIDLLDGLLSEPEAKQEVARATRRFFRKQLGWYRRDPRITWLTAGEDGNVRRIIDTLDSSQTS